MTQTRMRAYTPQADQAKADGTICDWGDCTEPPTHRVWHPLDGRRMCARHAAWTAEHFPMYAIEPIDNARVGKRKGRGR